MDYMTFEIPGRCESFQDVASIASRSWRIRFGQLLLLLPTAPGALRSLPLLAAVGPRFDAAMGFLSVIGLSTVEERVRTPREDISRVQAEMVHAGYDVTLGMEHGDLFASRRDHSDAFFARFHLAQKCSAACLTS